MLKKLKRVLIGRPLKSKAIEDEKYGILWGLPILSSDAISSVAYAGQEMLLVLLPAIGLMAYGQLPGISFAIIGLLVLLTLSYRQTIDKYPNGGGAYTVAKENLGLIAGVSAGAALSIDYVLTVAVSISSAVEQITSAFIWLKPYTVIVGIVLVLFMMVGNLRGIRESSKFFGIPAYAFIFGIFAMLLMGFVNYNGNVAAPPATVQNVVKPIAIILVLRAFSNGCTALTGVEAVSNAVPNFKQPSPKHAKIVLLLLATIVLLLFGGTSILAYFYQPEIGEKAMLIQLAEQIFGRGFMFYYITATTFIILVMAANTAYSGFPLLVAVMARDGYAPRQLSMRGDRLSYSNGIIALSAAAILLIIIFKAKVTSLVGLYAIGVFISFTLSQSGMLVRWFKEKGKHWHWKAFVNGLGAAVTGTAVLVVAVTKFHEGAWLVVLVIPILIIGMLRVHKHYKAIAEQLRVTNEELDQMDFTENLYANRVIVPIQSVNKSSIRALRYAKTISDNVVAFCVTIDEEYEKKIREKYSHIKIDVPLVVRYSPFRKVVEPLLRFIDSEEYNYKKGDIITVILPQFNVKSFWHKLLHNYTGVYIQRELLKHKHIVVSIMPLQLKSDDTALKKFREKQ
ncbi:MAG: amino acid/polyamine/organocation transporter, superfamily [Eubacterium sp.]|jgi:amino acid transporter|nr:amino acid/polyamine/organocation transporter, superfamily [Eubacterium sp.]